MTIDELIRSLRRISNGLHINKPLLIKDGNTKHRTLRFNGRMTLVSMHKKSEIPEGTLDAILKNLGLKKRYITNFNKKQIKQKLKELRIELTEPVAEEILDKIFSEEENDS